VESVGRVNLPLGDRPGPQHATRPLPRRVGPFTLRRVDQIPALASDGEAPYAIPLDAPAPVPFRPVPFQLAAAWPEEEVIARIRSVARLSILRVVDT
jgi:hypothetical protein